MWQTLHLRYILTVVGCVVIVSSQLPKFEVYSHFKTVPLSTNERERANQALASQFSLTTLNPISPTLANVEVTHTPTPEPLKPKSHIVKEGETLTKIADTYGLHNGTIVLANPQLQNVEVILEGDTLTIPTQDASSTELAKEYKDRNARLATTAFAASRTITSIAKTTVLQTVPAPTTESFQMPMSSYTEISQGYSSVHRGVDFATPQGTPVYAIQSGCVTEASTGWSGGYGRMVRLEHGNGFSSLYAHLSAIVSYSGCVNSGQLIGYSGNTGNSTGAHLHFEIHQNGITLNPLNYVR